MKNSEIRDTEKFNNPKQKKYIFTRLQNCNKLQNIVIIGSY